ncbi:hypothetical protein GCM10023193_60180 [Planotetraspora kaengkrachanensis]|uniref:hypothetical protein n=1 Tax=Planotetraspora kaengkrachanensis TaxID=575193 RepID=UPI0031E82FA4
MAVLISRRHASTSGNSYTTPVDATDSVCGADYRQRSHERTNAAKDRDRAIADAMGEIVKQGLGAKDDGDDPPLFATKIN